MKEIIIKKIDCDKVKGLPILVILVGESGSGKTTFVKMMGCKNNWFESSKAMVNALIQRGEPVTHDTIHSFANKAYQKNPRWQVPNIMKALKEKDFLLFDGPRRIQEVKAVLESYPRVIIIRIAISSDKLRFGRLKRRDGIDKKDFSRLLRDETSETELMQIIFLADLTIFNNGSIEDLKRKAIELKEILLTIDNFSHI